MTNSEATALAAATAGEAVDAARAQYDNLLAVIRRSPLQAAGIAAGAGLLLGLFLKSR